MRNRMISVSGHEVPLAIWGELNNQNLPIHFAQGNSFVAGVYRQMCEILAQQYTVYATQHRAVWPSTRLKPPPLGFKWSDAANDLIASLDVLLMERKRQGFPKQKFIGVGHSLGGIMTLLAAQRRPDLFAKIVLIEPVLFPTRSLLAIDLIPMAWRYRYLPMAKRTLNRRDVWPSRQEFIDYHMSKPAFHDIPLSVMRDYAEYGLREREMGKGFELTFPKAWEAHIFRSISGAWHAVRRLQVPCVAIRGANSHWIPEEAWQKWQRLRPDCPLVLMPEVGHLAPLQRPQAMSQLVLEQLAEYN